MKQKDKYDIFISYRREDGAIFAESIAYNLREQGYKVFFDKKELKIGTDFPNELENAIIEAKEFIAIVTESYFGNDKSGIRIQNENDWIHREVSLAMNASQVNIFPILIGTTAPDQDTLPVDIKEICERNFYTYNNQYDTVEKIVDTLKIEFHPETIENAITGKIINEINGVDIHNNKEFNIVCKKIITFVTSDMEVNALKHILEYSTGSAFYYEENYRFVAFYTLFSFYRRMHYVDKLIELVEGYTEVFNKYDFFYYAMVEYYTLKFQLAKERNSEVCFLNNMVKYAELANEKIEDNNGIIHSFCISIALAYENGIGISDDTMNKALMMIDKIIENDPMYARYYSTKARLLTCVSRYDEALKNIRYAQSIERPDYNDWMLRIASYYKEECIIRMKQLESRT